MNTFVSDASCIYEIGWDATEPQLEIAINRRLAARARKTGLSKKTPIVRDIRSIFPNLGYFNGVLNGHFGFKSGLEVQDIGDADYIYVTAPLPAYQTAPCKCVAQHPGCRLCNDKHERAVIDQVKQDVTTINLSLLFAHLHSVRQKAGGVLSRYKQLIALELSVGQTMFGRARDSLYFINGKLSPSLQTWLQRTPAGQLPQVTTALQTAGEAMYGNRRRLGSFTAKIDTNKQVTVRLGDTGCQVHSKKDSLKSSGILTTGDQLILLAGLAALHQRAREETIIRLN